MIQPDSRSYNAWLHAWFGLGVTAFLLCGSYALAAAPANSDDRPTLISNGSMTEGDAVPTGWSLGGSHVGKVSLRRDLTVFRSAPAALLLTTEGKATGFALQRLTNAPSGPIRIRGWAKAEGTFKSVQVAMQAFDSNWKQLEWKTVAIIQPGGDWREFDVTFALPTGAVNVVTGLLVDGDGKAWLDDFTVTSAETEPPPPPAFALDEALPVDVRAEAKELRRVGRFDASDPTSLRFAWSACSVTARFNAAAINLRLADDGGNRFEVVLDGKSAGVLKPRHGSHLYRLADALPPGEHAVSFFKRTEANCGVASFQGFQLPQGATLIAVPREERRIEVIGDSISCGYGNEATSQNVHFSPDTENAYQSYGAVAARALGAEYVCIAWSGKKLWPNNAIPDLYDRILPDKADSKWDFPAYQPQAVAINLGTNDFGGGNPEEEGWVKAYHAFLDRIRHNYPEARIYLAIGPMMSDQYPAKMLALTTVRRYVTRVVDECHRAGDQRVSVLEFAVQDWKNGLGADWHPSVKTHGIMAEKLAEAVAKDLDWGLKPQSVRDTPPSH